LKTLIVAHLLQNLTPLYGTRNFIIVGKIKRKLPYNYIKFVTLFFRKFIWYSTGRRSCKTETWRDLRNNFFYWNIGGWNLGPLGTAATNRPIVPAPGDYDDGEIGGMIGRGNRSIQRKPAPVPLCPPQTLLALPGRGPGPPRWEASV
jgi:hypothetical protein